VHVCMQTMKQPRITAAGDDDELCNLRIIDRFVKSQTLISYLFYAIISNAISNLCYRLSA